MTVDPGQAETQGRLDRRCAECVVGRLASEAGDRELRIKESAKKRLDGLIQELAETQLNTKAERLEHEARAYLEALSTTKILSEREVTIYETAISEAVKVRPEPPRRETFISLPGTLVNDSNVRKVYPQERMTGVVPDSTGLCAEERLATEFYEVAWLCAPGQSEDRATRAIQISGLTQLLRQEGKRAANQMLLAVSNFVTGAEVSKDVRERADNLMTELARYQSPSRGKPARRKTRGR